MDELVEVVVGVDVVVGVEVVVGVVGTGATYVELVLVVGLGFGLWEWWWCTWYAGVLTAGN